VAAERLRPGAGERDLPDRGRGLAVFQLERAFGQPEHRAAERDRARRHHQELAPLRMQLGDVGHQRGEPRLLDAPGLGIDQQGRSDLDDDPAEVRQ
jgi:hypothetical protein